MLANVFYQGSSLVLFHMDTAIPGSDDNYPAVQQLSPLTVVLKQGLVHSLRRGIASSKMYTGIDMIFLPSELSLH